MKIYAPVKDFNGLRNNVRFVNGVGETNDPNAIAWFESHGYKVPIAQDSEKIVKNSEIVKTTEKSAEPDFDAMTPNELRDWGRANGFAGKIKNTRDKEKLLKIIKG